jgi:hypothetical protein
MKKEVFEKGRVLKNKCSLEPARADSAELKGRIGHQISFPRPINTNAKECSEYVITPVEPHQINRQKKRNHM